MRYGFYSSLVQILLLGLLPFAVAESCVPTLPLTAPSHVMAVGNSFLGSLGGSCRHLEELLESNGDPEEMRATCDIMFGNPLGAMLDEAVVANAVSGSYNVGLFISGESDAMENFAHLYRENCMAPVILMTWESLNPLAGLDAYRNGIAAVIQRVRAAESATGARVVPYGLILYHLSLDPPPQLAHLPVDYLYVANGNIHDNSFSFWLKANALHATLLQRSPEGITHDLSFYQWGGQDLPLLHSGVLTDEVIRELQRRIWRLIQRWESGESVSSLMQFETAEIPTYSLTVEHGDDDGAYAAGTRVSITADAAPAGWFFAGWAGDTEWLADNLATTTLVMPNRNISLTAVYREHAESAPEAYNYLRLEITELLNNSTLHLVEATWLDAAGRELLPAMTSNATAGLQLSTNYPFAGALYQAFDRNDITRFYLSTQSQTLPIHVTLHTTSPVAPAAIRIRNPVWNNNLQGLRCWGSLDGENWQLLFETGSASTAFSGGALVEAHFNF